MAVSAPIAGKSAGGRRAAIVTGAGLRQMARDKLIKAVEQALASASDDTLADIVGTSDLRHALSIAPRDLPPPPPERLAAVMAAQAGTTRFREEMAERAGGMYDRAQVAQLLGVTPAAIDKQRQRRQLLAVPYGSELRYPAAQFTDVGTITGLKRVIENLGDMNPWGQLQLLTAPLDGYGAQPMTVLEILATNPDADTMRQIIGLTASWAA